MLEFMQLQSVHVPGPPAVQHMQQPQNLNLSIQQLQQKHEEQVNAATAATTAGQQQKVTEAVINVEQEKAGCTTEVRRRLNERRILRRSMGGNKDERSRQERSCQN